LHCGDFAGGAPKRLKQSPKFGVGKFPRGPKAGRARMPDGTALSKACPALKPLKQAADMVAA
jgi:hypothetical protein